MASMNTTFVKDASAGELRDATNTSATSQQPSKFRKSGENKREPVMPDDDDENLSDVSNKGLAMQRQRKRKLGGKSQSYFREPV